MEGSRACGQIEVPLFFVPSEMTDESDETLATSCYRSSCCFVYYRHPVSEIVPASFFATRALKVQCRRHHCSLQCGFFLRSRSQFTFPLLSSRFDLVVSAQSSLLQLQAYSCQLRTRRPMRMTKFWRAPATLTRSRSGAVRRSRYSTPPRRAVRIACSCDNDVHHACAIGVSKSKS